MNDLGKLIILGLAILVVIALWRSTSTNSNGNGGGHNTETLGAARWVGQPDIVERVRALRSAQITREKQPTPEYDAVFFPPPAVTQYITSVQFEHLQNEEPKFDLDYQPINKFQLVIPSTKTLEAYKTATREQIQYLKQQLHRLFDRLRSRVRMSNMTFNMPFKSAHDWNERFIRNWRDPEVQEDLLISYLHKVNDQIWSDFQSMFYKAGYNVDPSGRSARVDIANQYITSSGRDARLTQAGFDNPQNLTETAAIDGISDKPRNIGTFFDHIRPEDKAHAARKYVDRIYNDLVDHYKYQIRDMPPNAFAARAGEIQTTGLEILVHYLASNDGTPTKYDLDAFIDQVEESMRESLFGILMDNSVDITQFD